MKNILQTIKNHKIQEVKTRKTLRSITDLESTPQYKASCLSLSKSILDPSKNGLITEFKRKSPSKGVIKKQVEVKQIIDIYQHNGASAISVLHDQCFFGAYPEDLANACAIKQVPILQKDFIIDPYQIIEAKSLGADAILLIAKILETDQIKQLIQIAHQQGLEVLLETHSQQEIQRCAELDYDLIGINNRNLQDFKVDIENSILLAKMLPENAIKIAESGLENTQVVKTLKQHGFKGFLIGEYFMKQTDPKTTLQQFIRQLNE